MDGCLELIDPSVRRTRGPRNFNVLGAPVHAVDMEAALAEVMDWRAHEGRFICVADVHSIMLARRDLRHRAHLQTACMVLPDGMPLVWTGRLRGERGVARVCGPDFMAALGSNPPAAGWGHFFRGGGEGVAENLALSLQRANPDLIVCGLAAPPYRLLTAAEDRALVQQIAQTRPDVIWVGLGCPKQEAWMAEHCRYFPGAVLVGVGAAFDFHAGRVKRAPKWMQGSGLEWMHRLSMEPRRLWRRYLLSAPAFIGLASLETLLLALGRLTASRNVASRTAADRAVRPMAGQDG